MKVIHLIRPIQGLVPEVEKPTSTIPFREKVLWTSCALLVYMVLSNLPLFGVQRASSSDPFYWMRVILASNRGTLMELGVSPLVTTGMVMQLLAGAKVIDVNLDNKEDRVLFMTAQKVVGVLTTAVMAIAYVMSGMYGDFAAIGTGNAILIVTQLTLAGVLLLLLDEMMQRGYGLGSGISLFIAAHISETIVWSAVSPTTVNIGRGTEYQGAILALFHAIVVKRSLGSIFDAFTRQNLPNICNLVATASIFGACIYLQLLRVKLMIKMQRSRGLERPYHIKLFYTSNMPIILHTALISNIYFVSQMIYNAQPTSPFIKFFGEWAKDTSVAGHVVPVGGLVSNICVKCMCQKCIHHNI